MTRVEQYGATGGTYDYQSNEVHSYDENGNRTNTGYSTGTNNRLLSDGVYDYLYDAEGNRTKKTEIATGDATEYQWDHRNRLVKVTHLDSGGTPTQTLDFKYDIFDRRIGRSDTPAVGPAYLEDYVYDGEHLALEFEAGALANRYLHGPVIDQLLADVSWRPNSTTDWRLKRYQLIPQPRLTSDGRLSLLKADPREPHGESTGDGQVLCDQ